MSNHIILGRFGIPCDLSESTFQWWTENVFLPQGVAIGRTKAFGIITALRFGTEGSGTVWANFEHRTYVAARRRRNESAAYDGMSAFFRTFIRRVRAVDECVYWELGFPSRIVWRDPLAQTMLTLESLCHEMGNPSFWTHPGPNHRANVRPANRGNPEPFWSNDDYCRFHAGLHEPPMNASNWEDTHLSR